MQAALKANRGRTLDFIGRKAVETLFIENHILSPLFPISNWVNVFCCQHKRNFESTDALSLLKFSVQCPGKIQGRTDCTFPCGKSITIAQGNTCERTSTPTECLSAGPGQKLSLHNHNRNHDEAASVTTTTTMSTGCPRVFYPWQILVQQSAATATATATETTTAASKKKSLVEMLQEQRKRVAESLTMANAQQNC